MTRARVRDLGIAIGDLPTGEHNAITDVAGVRVGHVTMVEDDPRVIRTGVTMIAPRSGEVWYDSAFAGHHSFNGNGEMTGLLWLEESGMLGSAVGITNTHQVGRRARRAGAVLRGDRRAGRVPPSGRRRDL